MTRKELAKKLAALAKEVKNPNFDHASVAKRFREVMEHFATHFDEQN